MQTRSNIQSWLHGLVLLTVFIWLAAAISARADDTNANDTATSSQSQTNSAALPNYEQTRDWILSKTNQLGGDVSYYNTFVHLVYGESCSYKNISMDNCTLKYTVVVVDAGTNGIASSGLITTVAVPLDKVINVQIDDAATNAVDQGIRILNFSTGTQAIHINVANTYDGETHYYSRNVSSTSTEGSIISALMGTDNVENSLVFGQPDSDREDIAERMKKAFENLVRICKESPSKSNEPF
jgi:hypothetical protein